MDISVLKGLTLQDVDVGEYSITFTTTCGRKFLMYHEQDCCEHVYIESIVGRVNDLIGHPLLIAEEVDGENSPPDNPYESYTWTFYKLATIKGYVDIRWLGESNGYYSESVDFKELK